MSRCRYFRLFVSVEITLTIWLILSIGLLWADDFQFPSTLGPESTASPFHIASNDNGFPRASSTSMIPRYQDNVPFRGTPNNVAFRPHDGIHVKFKGKHTIFTDTPRGTFQVASNKEDCEKWCREHRTGIYRCAICNTQPGCGPGYYPIRTFRGSTTNWYACAERVDSEGNRQACERWCQKYPQCEKCDNRSGCGPGYRQIRTFSGRGTNWHACTRRTGSIYQRETVSNQEACETWCKENRNLCDKCAQDTAKCGPGYAVIRSFRGPGENWHACRKRKRTFENK